MYIYIYSLRNSGAMYFSNKSLVYHLGLVSSCALVCYSRTHYQTLERPHGENIAAYENQDRQPEFRDH